MTEPMDVDEALAWAISYLPHLQEPVIPDEDRGAIATVVTALESLRARLRREREAIQKVRDEMEKALDLVPYPGIEGALTTPKRPSLETIATWLAALDAILKGEGTT